MFDLFHSEWRRFHRAVLGIAAAHLVGLALLSRAMDLTELGSQDELAFLVVYMLFAATLAVLQVGSYRQPSRWLWLIHRPLAPGRIFGAIALAACAMVTLAVGIPLLLFLIGMDALTTQIVDVRHYMTAFYAVAFAMMAWLAAAYACTSMNRSAGAIILAPLLLAIQPSSVWKLLPVAVVFIAWLAFVTYHGFRANRGAPVRRHYVMLLSALPLQIAFFFLIFQGVKGGIALGDLVRRGNTGRTVTTSTPVAELEAFMHQVTVKGWEDAIAGSTDPRAAGWRRQLSAARTTSIAPNIERFPVRNQLGNVGHPWWDGRRSVKWTFSHDAMMYHGRHPGTGDSRGWWGNDGAGSVQPFAEVPSGMMSRSRLYAISRDTLHQREIVRLPEGEWFTGAPTLAMDHMLILTNRRLLALRRQGDSSSARTLAWALPIENRSLQPITAGVAEMRDGWLISLFYFDDWEYDGFEFLLRPWQRVFHVDSAGRGQLIAERLDVTDARVSIGIVSSVPVASWWASPTLYGLAHLPDLIDSGLAHPARIELIPQNSALLAAGLALIIAAVVLAWLWLRRADVTPSRRRLWIAACALLGMPAFLSMVCIESRKPNFQ